MKKKLISVFIALFMAVCLAAGCGGSGEVRDPLDPGNTEQETGDFTVTLVLNGNAYVPQGNVTATWDDGMSRPVTAAFNSNGVANAGVLDGDYTVRISGLSNEYTYDPNDTVATNYQRKITLEIYRVTVLPEFKAPDGREPIYGAQALRNQGAYRVLLNGPADIYYCIFRPTVAGMYSVKSLLDITENAINPKYRICSGTEVGMRYDSHVDLDGGGAAGTYTVNFNYQTGFNYDEIGSVLIFGVKAETRTLEFPFTIDILVKRTGEYVRQDIMSNIVLPTEFKDVTPETADAFRTEKDAFMRGPMNARNFNDNMFYKKGLLDGSNVAFNKDTGYYHLYDKDTNTYGAVICAKITQASGVVDDSFSNVEYNGNKALTINDNYDMFYKKTEPKYGGDKEPHYLNYKLFIEGYAGIARHESIYPGITLQFADYAGVYGYADFCNSDGVYPVNEELHRFLQGYATNARLFMDGNGVAEVYENLKSAEEDQWLFACGYYTL